MYDTIHLWLPSERFASAANKDTCMQNLSKVCITNKADGSYYFTGYLKNYRVTSSEFGISLKGSLSKYYLSDNIQTLSLSDSVMAFEMMADELHLPISSAIVKRIDLAQNFLMRYEPEAYYQYLGDCQYYQRLTQPKSLYYTNSIRQMLFYNKAAEVRAKRQTLPAIWAGQNVLRYENRYTKRLTNQFNLPEITAKTLTEKSFYTDLINRWQSEYDAINKHNTINLNFTNMSSPKDFMRQITLLGLNVIGQERVMQEIENLRHLNAFEKPEYYSRLKRKVHKLSKTPQLTSSSDLVEELNQKIKTAKEHCR